MVFLLPSVTSLLSHTKHLHSWNYVGLPAGGFKKKQTDFCFSWCSKVYFLYVQEYQDYCIDLYQWMDWDSIISTNSAISAACTCGFTGELATLNKH